MKKIWKIIKGIIIVAYLVMASFIIVCLLKRNDYGVIELGNTNWVIISDDEFEPYKKNDLIILDKISHSDVEIGDVVFFYRLEHANTDVMVANVTNKEVVNEDETTFAVKDNYRFSSSYLIGRSVDSKTYGTIGGIIKFLISRWGFLFFIILPILMAFVYQIYAIVVEVKKELEED